MSTPAYPTRDKGPCLRSAMLIHAGRLRSGQDLVQSAACHQVPLRPNLSSAGTPTGSFFHQRCVQVAIYGAGQQLHTAGMVPHIICEDVPDSAKDPTSWL